MSGAPMSALSRLGEAASRADTELPAQTGVGSSGLVTTVSFYELADRLKRAELVRRSRMGYADAAGGGAGGYALLLVAPGRAASGASRRCCGRQGRRPGTVGGARDPGGAAGGPAGDAGLADPGDRGDTARRPGADACRRRAAAEPTARSGQPADRRGGGGGLRAGDVGPALRRAAATSRRWPAGRGRARRTVAQRAGADLALVALAVLGWMQLRQYSSPLAGAGAGGLGIDPLLAATPTVGVLAGAVLALRGLPPMARLVERFVDRRSWTGTTLGMWQAGRRPHAGPVLLLALAVAVGTLAWCLAATSERSLADQADHQVGADLRLVETSGVAPPARAGQLAGLPGTTEVLPAWRDSPRLGVEGVAGGMVALDAAVADRVVRLRDDLADGTPAELFAGLTAARITAPAAPNCPAGTRRLTGQISTADLGEAGSAPARAAAVFAEPAVGTCGCCSGRAPTAGRCGSTWNCRPAPNRSGWSGSRWWTLSPHPATASTGD